MSVNKKLNIRVIDLILFVVQIVSTFSSNGFHSVLSLNVEVAVLLKYEMFSRVIPF